ncbi:hypothetical protein JCM3774_002122 [Rhodotorula dairenensis]
MGPAARRYVEEEQVPGPGGRWIVAPPPPPPPANNNDSGHRGPAAPLFRAYHRSFPNQPQRRHDGYVWIEVADQPTTTTTPPLLLLEPLRKTFPTVASLYEQKPAIDLRSVYVHADALLGNAESEKARLACTELVTYARNRFAYVAETIASYPAGTISFHLLWSLFRAGEDLEAVHETTGERIAIRLDSWAYVQESLGRSLALSGHFYQWAGTCYHKVPITRKIREFVNLRAVNELSTFPLSETSKASLTERGQLYTQYAGQVHAEHEGFFFTRAFSGVSRLLGDGQVMIDVKGYRRTNPALDSWAEDSGQVDRHAEWSSSSVRTTRPCPDPAADQLHLLPPALHGFSFRAKRWGEFLVSRLAPIEWTSESFSHLVIPDAYRRIVKALVTVHSGRLKEQLMIDVVAGKGNGLVMAFHGPPGTGKTLTAEAIAEHLRRPLYVVSAGELGILPQVLENQLRDILALATEWNAVLLIDEADIFLQKRDARHLERNALVGVFLRQLEYFSGVLILTTNSIESFDDAFLSRFAVVLHFGRLDEASRRTLWSRFLARATGPADGAAMFDLDRLAGSELNGREIKHAVQTAQAVALVEDETLSMKHLEEVLSVARSGASVGRLASARSEQ